MKGVKGLKISKGLKQLKGLNLSQSGPAVVLLLFILALGAFDIRPVEFHWERAIYDATSAALSGPMGTMTGYATGAVPEACMKSVSVRESPEGTMECGGVRTGCLNGQDWKFYEVVGSAGKRVTVKLDYSGNGCGINDLYIYEGGKKIYYSVTNLKNEDWFGLPKSDITIGIDGDSENNNCRWELEVKCDNRMTEQGIGWPLPPTPPVP